MKQPREIVRAEKLRVVIQSNEYRETLGAWIEDAKNKALYDLENATEPHEVHRAQGAYRLIRDLTELITHTFQAEQAALEKLQSKLTK
jgi:hypothetical protein